MTDLLSDLRQRSVSSYCAKFNGVLTSVQKGIPDEYTVHCLHQSGPEMFDNQFSMWENNKPTGRNLIIHKSTYKFESFTDIPVPPKGVFDWHYMQCVYQRFGSSESSDEGRCFLVAELLDEESSDEDEDPSYPSAGFDALMRSWAQASEDKAKAAQVMSWRNGISS